MAAKKRPPKPAAKARLSKSGLNKSGLNRSGQNKSGQKTRRDEAVGAFCARARDALKRGAPDAISDRELQQILTAAAKIYAAKVERRGRDVAPFSRGTVTATETVVTACGMIRAADLNMFDVAIWFHRPQSIE